MNQKQGVKYTMNSLEKIFYEIGSNPRPFFYGWLSAIITIFLTLLIIYI
jgi:hypothetical protein